MGLQGAPDRHDEDAGLRMGSVWAVLASALAVAAAPPSAAAAPPSAAQL